MMIFVRVESSFLLYPNRIKTKQERITIGFILLIIGYEFGTVCKSHFQTTCRIHYPVQR